MLSKTRQGKAGLGSGETKALHTSSDPVPHLDPGAGQSPDPALLRKGAEGV